MRWLELALDAGVALWAFICHHHDVVYTVATENLVATGFDPRRLPTGTVDAVPRLGHIGLPLLNNLLGLLFHLHPLPSIHTPDHQYRPHRHHYDHPYHNPRNPPITNNRLLWLRFGFCRFINRITRRKHRHRQLTVIGNGIRQDGEPVAHIVTHNTRGDRSDRTEHTGEVVVHEGGFVLEINRML